MAEDTAEFRKHDLVIKLSGVQKDVQQITNFVRSAGWQMTHPTLENTSM